MKIKLYFFILAIGVFNQTFNESLYLIEPKAINGILNNQFLILMKNLFNISVFIETGTADGTNALQVSKIFNEVYSTEINSKVFKLAQEKLEDKKNIHLYLGDSKQTLITILSQVNNAPLIYLDAHCSGPGSGKGDENTPILHELEIIKNSKIKNAIILIDDARLFQDEIFIKKELILEPTEENLTDYPNLNQLKKAILEINSDYKVIIYGDMIIAFTNNDIEISPVIKAMTLIRFYDINKNDVLDLLDALKTISQAKDSEKTAIEGLILRNGLGSPKLYTLNYLLWYMLILINNKNKDAADREINKILDFFIPAN